MFTLFNPRHSFPFLGLICLVLASSSFPGHAQNLPASVDGTPPEIQYPQTPLRFILQDYETVSGKLIVKDFQIIDMQITIETVHPIETREEWLDYMERALLLNGIALIPVSDNILKAVGWRAGSTPGREGIQTYSEASEVPDGEQVINYIMELEFVTTEEAMRIFQEVTKNAATPYAAITVVPDTNMLVITENALVVRQLIKLKDEIDVEPAKVKTQVFQLLRADAATVSQAINDILSQQEEQRGGAGGGTTARRTPSAPQVTARPGTAPTPGGAAAVASPSPTGTPGTTQPIVVYPDERTNRLIVIGRPLDVAYIENLVETLDAEAEVKRFIRRPLHHVSVVDALPVLADALAPFGEAGASGLSGVGTSNLGGGRTGGGGAGGFGGGTQQFGGGAGGFGGGRGGRGGTQQFGGGAGGFGGTQQFGGGGGAGLGGGGGVSGFGIEEGGPIAVPVGVSTLLIADPKINTILATGPPEHLLLVNTILDEIDVKPRQVYISTIIGQVTLGDSINLGVDLLHQVQEYEVGGRTVRSGGLFATGGDSGNLDLDSLPDVDAFPNLAGLNYYGQIGDFVNTYLHALERTSRFEVISRPSIYLSNNRPGYIVSGQEIAVPSSTQSSLGGVSTAGLISNIQYRKIALELTVQPLIHSDDEVTLQISQVNNTVSGSTNIQGTEVPNINNQELHTEITVPNKSTIVLGGLITESRNDSKSGLPLLIHVPILKHLFGGKSEDRDRQELLIFIQPHIVNDAADLVNANIEMTENNRVTRSALEFNKRESAPPADEGEAQVMPKESKESKESFWQRFRSERSK